MWARGSGDWLSREATETAEAFSRTYEYKLHRDARITGFQMGLDLGSRDLLAPGDALVFGILGGWVQSDLEYDAVARHFDVDGTQVGAYATYLRGGLFVDTLFKADILDHEQDLLGFPDGFDATSLGVRTDAGYRFGSFRSGPFIEPLATIGVVWSELEDFALGGNQVSFGDDPNWRGRVGLRVGTGYQPWTGVTLEPFLIASLWSDLGDAREATLVSSGETFNFEDDPEEIWGEVSAGVNLFNPSANTAVFAKVDVTFGEDLEGVGARAGMRVSW
ncbi:MAG: autotransporter outer membrane beta-barrel domain-containing protein [Methyloceanibacter sp.]|uniref:autotransporter outer membrane beta-barrel domain-containing protein n=1 Tax=Methyloceanibacter sp. TaxID=1965321 RepID=UPI003D6D1463